MFARRLALGMLAATLCGCVHNNAPQGYLAGPLEAGHAVRGGWVEIDVASGATSRQLQGELLGVSPDTLWIETSDSVHYVVARTSIVGGKVTEYRAGTLAGVTALGAVSAVSNGWLGLITIPAWILTGTVANYADHRAAERDLPADLTPGSGPLLLARFPQGIPPAMRGSFRVFPPAS